MKALRKARGGTVQAGTTRSDRTVLEANVRERLYGGRR